MDKLYLLTSGQYSDHHVEGVFSSLEKVEEYKLQHKRLFLNYEREIYKNEPDEELLEMYIHNFNDPIEISVDEAILPSGFQPYDVIMDTNGDNAEVCYSESYNYWYKEFGLYKNILTFEVLAKDKAHAIKIANDRRIQLIANKQI